jgi:hypothetical protein
MTHISKPSLNHSISKTKAMCHPLKVQRFNQTLRKLVNKKLEIQYLLSKHSKIRVTVYIFLIEKGLSINYQIICLQSKAIVPFKFIIS